jgi:hypothetical protein
VLGVGVAGGMAMRENLGERPGQTLQQQVVSARS